MYFLSTAIVILVSENKRMGRHKKNGTGTGEGVKARVKLKPGQKGTKKLMELYGDALICVRYRYDAERRKQLKTVEIVVTEKDWTPPPAKFPDGALVPLRIGISEKSTQDQVKALGGRWDRKQQLWFVPYGCIAGTRLEKLIVIETTTNREQQAKIGKSL
jgi:hypothetical protein